MYISIRRYQVDDVDVDELMQQVEEGFVPIVSQVPGFIGYYAIDTGNGVVASINIFADRSGVEESDRRAAQWVAGVRSMFPNPPQITEGEARIASNAD